MQYIKQFSELGKSDVPTVGGKGANLREMFNNEIPVPPGFCITAQAYEKFAKDSGVWHEIIEILKDLDVEDTAKLEEVSNKIQKLILKHDVPEDIAKEIAESYKALQADFVAVRSSATAEDLPEASFAGQQATY